MMPLIELNHVFMNFKVGEDKYIQASYDVNLQVNRKDMIAIIGESGCGKSTIGRICLGVQKPSRGAVFYNGHYIWDSDFKWSTELRASVQVVHQDPFSSLNPVKTIFQTLSAPLYYYKLAAHEEEALEKVTELLKLVDLAPVEFFLHKYPFQLSGGQKQRVSIARATILRPKVILADEPVSAVDASGRLSILDLMKSLREKYGIAFIYITHDLATARYFAPEGKLVVMYLGRMVETGIIDDCVKNPCHPYLQALLKAIPTADPLKSKKPVKLPLKSLDLPSSINPPTGCVFNPRCPYSTDICEKEHPELELISKSNNHKVACHHKEKLNK